MSEGWEIAVNPEVEDLVYRMRAAEERLAALSATISRAQAASCHTRWALTDRLLALAQERPGVRWRVGDTVYWTEGQLLRSGPAPANPR